MPDFRIVEAGQQDCSRIVALAWEIWPEWYHAIIGPEQIGYMLGQLYQPELIQNRMEKGLRYYILSKGGRDAGFFALNCSQSPVCRLENLYLTRAVRGKGFGDRMLEKISDLARKAGSSRIQCNVNRFNPATGFYFSRGFRTVEIADIPFGPFFLNDFIIEKELFPES